MNEYVMIPFTVHKEKIEEAKTTISELISKVRENEPKTLLYKSLQLKKDPASFIHFMIFADNAAHMQHRSAPYVLDFVKKLYDLCPNEPYPIFLDSFDSCGALVQELEK
jgi:quinol monooxygenase YgiN